MHITKNKSKKFISNILTIFLVLEFFNIQIKECMIVSFVEKICKIIYTNWLKMNISDVFMIVLIMLLVLLKKVKENIRAVKIGNPVRPGPAHHGFVT